MKRTRMKRGAPLKRGGRIKPKKRTASEFNRIYGSRARVAWVKSLPCLACLAIHPAFAVTAGTSHNAHTETGGIGYKAGYETIVPLCSSHHRRYDEHMAPFDAEEARQAMKDAAQTVAATWNSRNEAGQVATCDPNFWPEVVE
jgi:hypothetical protein